MRPKSDKETHVFQHLIRVTFYCSSAIVVKCNPNKVIKIHALSSDFFLCSYRKSYLSNLESYEISGCVKTHFWWISEENFGSEDIQCHLLTKIRRKYVFTEISVNQRSTQNSSSMPAFMHHTLFCLWGGGGNEKCYKIFGAFFA